MDKNQKAELYDNLDDLFNKLREAQSTVALLAYLLSSEGGNPSDKYVKENFSSALHIANDALYNVWEKMTDLALPLKQALTEVHQKPWVVCVGLLRVFLCHEDCLTSKKWSPIIRAFHKVKQYSVVVSRL